MKTPTFLILIFFYILNINLCHAIDENNYTSSSLGFNLVNNSNLKTIGYNLELNQKLRFENDGLFGIKSSLAFGNNFNHFPAGMVLGIPLLLASTVRRIVDPGKYSIDDDFLIVMGIGLILAEGAFLEINPFKNIYLSTSLSPLRFSKLKDNHNRSNKYFLSVASSISLSYEISKIIEFNINSEVTKMYTNRPYIHTIGISGSISFI